MLVKVGTYPTNVEAEYRLQNTITDGTIYQECSNFIFCCFEMRIAVSVILPHGNYGKIKDKR